MHSIYNRCLPMLLYSQPSHIIYATELTYIFYTRKQPDLPISLAYAIYMYSYHIHHRDIEVTYHAHLPLNINLPFLNICILHTPAIRDVGEGDCWTAAADVGEDAGTILFQGTKKVFMRCSSPITSPTIFWEWTSFNTTSAQWTSRAVSCLLMMRHFLF